MQQNFAQRTENTVLLVPLSETHPRLYLFLIDKPEQELQQLHYKEVITPVNFSYCVAPIEAVFA